MKDNFLTAREKEVFDLLVKNKTSNEISKILGISPKTCRNHISNVISKLGVKSRTQAILELLKLDIIKLE